MTTPVRSKAHQVPGSDLDHVLEHTQRIWKQLGGQSIFITGGTGFFGKWLLESFLWANRVQSLNAKAVVLTRRPDVFRTHSPHLAENPAIELVQGDVRSFRFPALDRPFIIHAAAETVTRAGVQDCRPVVNTIVDGTRRVLEFACHSGARKLLFVSSGAVYGRQPTSLSSVTEEFTGAPALTSAASLYGEAKRLAELMCVLEAERCGFDAPIARCFAFVGPHLPLDAHFAIGNFIRNALQGDAIQVNGDGTPYRSYLYSADLAIWLWSLLIRGQSRRSYNVGSDEAITIADLAGIVRETVAPKTVVRIAHVPKAGGAAERYVPSTQRARDELGLRCHIPLREAIRRTARWYKQCAVH